MTLYTQRKKQKKNKQTHLNDWFDFSNVLFLSLFITVSIKVIQTGL